ncbi:MULTISPECIES: AlpA family transcriptional regulator [unclassified Halomonas]|uniref:helix-turn-helix transcriptional regulator n=1 Tax=unclassified Halomonas TaxID=2609666 RepID=UPI001EF561A6|nr:MULTISPECIES: AlpA family transcriptional regulator [unclassified Halomonas]MCG7589579.1 AlpA family transcriptional regulator [Halomonas sp. McD50-5]MCG7615740.1 AlpA family transcriptional regulator [Halomonas sp. McD50-4]
METLNAKPMALLRLKQVIAITGLSRSSIYSMLDEDSSSYDPDFPKQVKIGKKSVAWVENEVDQWIVKRIAARQMKKEK